MCLSNLIVRAHLISLGLSSGYQALCKGALIVITSSDATNATTTILARSSEFGAEPETCWNHSSRIDGSSSDNHTMLLRLTYRSRHIVYPLG